MFALVESAVPGTLGCSPACHCHCAVENALTVILVLLVVMLLRR